MFMSSIELPVSSQVAWAARCRNPPTRLPSGVLGWDERPGRGNFTATAQQRPARHGR